MALNIELAQTEIFIVMEITKIYLLLRIKIASNFSLPSNEEIIQCLLYILRKSCKYCIHLRNIPSEINSTVKTTVMYILTLRQFFAFWF